MAAGSSSRLGRPKQLLPFRSETLIEHSIKTAISTNRNCNVVLGSNYNAIKNQIEKYPLTVFNHQDWSKGMGSSISFGLKEVLKKQPNLDDVLILLCDQPYIDSELLNTLFQNHFDKLQLITACSYGNAFGVPAIFNKKIFPDLLKLKGDKGAKKIISDNPNGVLYIDFPEGNIDIDQVEDLKYLK